MSSALEDLETRLKNQNTHAEAAAEAVDLFGSKAGPALVDAVSTGRLSFAELGTVMSDFAGNVETTFEATLDPMDELTTQMNELKSTGADLVEAAAPLIRDVLGKASSLVTKVSDALRSMNDEQKQTIIKTGAVVAAIGPALMVAGKVVSAVGTVTKGVGKALQLAPKVVSGVKGATTAVLGLNPAVLAVGGTVGAVVAVGAAWYAWSQKQIDATYGLTDAQKEENAQIAASAEAYREQEAARKESMGGISNEYGYYQSLVGELETITDANGKVKDGYEDRAAVITSLLSDALGVEIGLTDGVIENYGELIGNIDQLIVKKKAEAMVLADQGAYEEAIQKVGDAETEYLAKVNETAEALSKLEAAQRKYDEVQRKAAASGTPSLGMIGLQLQAARELAGAQKTYNELAEAEKNAADKYVGLTTTISNHEALIEASQSGKDLELAMQNVTSGFITANVATKEQLQEQYNSISEHYEQLKTAAANGAQNITDETLKEWAELTKRAAVELSKGGRKGGEDYDTGVAAGIDSKQNEVTTAAEGMKSSTDVDLTEEGKTVGEGWGAGLVRGILNYKAQVAATATSVASVVPSNTRITLQERSPSHIAEGIGEYWDGGLIKGMRKGIPAVADMSRAVSEAMISPAFVQSPVITAAQQSAAGFGGIASGGISGGNVDLREVVSLLGKIADKVAAPIGLNGERLLDFVEDGIGTRIALKV